MNRSDMDAAVQLLTRSQRGILLMVPETLTTDTFAAMLALALALDRLGKSPTMVSPRFVPEHLQFLPGTSQVRKYLDASADMVVEFPIGNARPRDVHWEIVNKQLRVTVRGQQDTVHTRDIHVRSGGYPWDTVVTIGAPDLEALGPLALEHALLFAETSVVNIDHGTQNTFFGTANVVPPTASAVSEVILDLLETLGDTTLTAEVATCLFAGIAAATDSFRAPTLTPKVLHTASRLLHAGADHQNVIQHLFRTHSLPELRLLGRALARLEELAPNAVLTIVTGRDFQESEATPDVIPSILKEIREWTGQTRTTFLAFARTPNTFEVLIAPEATLDEQQEALRASLDGVVVGPFILVNLGTVPAERVAAIIGTELAPRLSGVARTGLPTTEAGQRVPDTSVASRPSARA